MSFCLFVCCWFIGGRKAQKKKSITKTKMGECLRGASGSEDKGFAYFTFIEKSVRKKPKSNSLAASRERYSTSARG